MKKTLLKLKKHGQRALTALAMFLPYHAAAQSETQLACWNFNYAYTIKTDGTATPSTTAIENNSDMDLAGIKLRPNYQALVNGDYSLTATRPARSEANPMQSSKAAYLEFQSINAAGAALHLTNPLPTSKGGSSYAWGGEKWDYPNGQTVTYQQPYNYFQAELPTTGYKNVTLKIKAAGHKAAKRCYAIATSIDGNNWNILGEEYLTGTSYNNWNTEEVSLGKEFDGLEKAYVRIFPSEKWKTNSDTPFKDNQFDIDELTICGDEDIQIDPTQFLPISVTIDGNKNNEMLKALLADEGHKATFSQWTFTRQPKIEVAMSSGKAATVDEPTVDGDIYTYQVKASIKNNEWKGTIVVHNVYTYNAAENDLTHTLSPGTGTSDSGWWNDGSVTTDFTGDWAFKLKNGTYRIAIPTNWKIKQIAFLQSSDNYSSDGFIASATSEDAYVYVPHDTQFEKSTEKDIYFTVDHHHPGRPFLFTIQNGSQVTLKKISIVYEEIPTRVAPLLTNIRQTSTEQTNHCVVVANFSHAVATVEACVDGQPVVCQGEGTATVKFNVWDLNYGQTTNLTIKAGKLTDNYGNVNTDDIVIPIKVGTRAKTESSTIDYVVSNTDELRKAIATIEENDEIIRRRLILLLNGDYDMKSNPLNISTDKISLIGESRDGVLIHGTLDGITNPIVNCSKSSETHLENLTLRNDQNWAMEDKRGVAVALTGGKKTTCKNIVLQSNQDTYVSGESGYMLDCDIHGTVDFICGGGDHFFDRCNLILEDRKGDVIVAPNHTASIRFGYVFSNCTIKAAKNAQEVINGSYNLGRPWQNCPRAAFLNTKMDILPNSAGWTGMSKGLETHFYEFGSVDANGQPIDLSVRNVEACASSNGNYAPVLTANEAANLNLRNVTCGMDSWDVSETVRKLSSTTVSLDGKTLNWRPVEEARCYLVFKNGRYLCNTTSTVLELQTDNYDTFIVYPINNSGSLGLPSNEVVYDTANAIKNGTEMGKDNKVEAFSLNGTPIGPQQTGTHIYIIKGKKTIKKQ